MRWKKSDFTNKKEFKESYYDIFEDWDLIEASFAEQYGIRLRHEKNMPWGEFATLLAGISPKTALGQIVSIRAEKNKDVIKNFTPEQKRIRHEWRTRLAKRQIEEDPEGIRKQLDELQAAFKAAFYTPKKQEGG